MPGRGWWVDGVTGTPVGDVISGGAALNVAMFMVDRFKVPDCIFLRRFLSQDFYFICYQRFCDKSLEFTFDIDSFFPVGNG